MRILAARLGLVFFTISCLSIPAWAAPLPGSGRTVFLSLTRPGTIHRFIERYPIRGGELILTQRPLGADARSVAVREGSGEQLFVVELQGPQSLTDRKLPGELTRVAGHAVVSLPVRSPAITALWRSPALRLHPIGRTETLYRQYSPALPPLRRWEARITQSSPLAIDPAFLKRKLDEFSGAAPASIGGRTVTIAERGTAAGRDMARAYLKQEYEKLGFRVSLHNYGSAGQANFVAEKAGHDPHVVIVSSHLDSVHNPGADDDGAGTISALAVAQALAGATLKYTLRIVAFDEEERGLVGSKAYAKMLDQTGEMARVIGVFHLEMNGYNKRADGAFHIIDCDQNTSASLSKLVMDAIASAGLPLHRVAACTSASDHSVFWRYNKPSIVTSENFFGGDGNPNYHTPYDRTDILSFDYMARIAEANAIAVARLTEAR